MPRLARISTRIACSEGRLWEEIVRPRSLQFVASPLLRFDFDDPQLLDRHWEIGRSYELRLYLLGWIPLGRHTIRLLRIDRTTNTIVSREGGRLARVWNHSIRFHTGTDGLLHYTDEIEIDAGLLTPGVWLFAQGFYRHRQRRWRRLLQDSNRGRPAV